MIQTSAIISISAKHSENVFYYALAAPMLFPSEQWPPELEDGGVGVFIGDRKDSPQDFREAPRETHTTVHEDALGPRHAIE